MSLDNIDFDDPNIKRLIAWQAIDSYKSFLNWCDQEIIYAISDIENQRDQLAKPEVCEDMITDAIASIIRARASLIGINVMREAAHSGHCDLIIQKGHYQWLCEAKIYKGPTYIYDGHKQLIERYLVGSNDYTSNAGMLIYFKNRDKVLTKVKSCRSMISTLHEGKVIDYESAYPLNFKSLFPHPITELPINVTYYNVSISHQSQPIDHTDEDITVEPE